MKTTGVSIVNRVANNSSSYTNMLGIGSSTQLEKRRRHNLIASKPSNHIKSLRIAKASVLHADLDVLKQSPSTLYSVTEEKSW